MEGEDNDFPVSQKGSGEENVAKESKDAVLSDGEFEYLSQVMDTTPSLSSTQFTDSDSLFVSQSGLIPLVPYEDEDDDSDSGGPKTDDETPNFFFGLLNDSLTDDLPDPTVAVPVTQSNADTQWLQSQGIDFNPAEW